MKAEKTYGVIGLGKFGLVVARELIDNGENVVIVDRVAERLKELQEKAACAYVLDSTNTVALKEAGFQEIDTVVVSIGENVEKSILTLMALKDIGVVNVVAKATSQIHGQILSKLGASKVIYPEKESAKRLVKEFVSNPDFEVIDLSANTIRAVAININDKLVGSSVKQVAQNLKVIALKQGTNDWVLFPDLETTLLTLGDKIILFGTSKELEKFHPPF